MRRRGSPYDVIFPVYDHASHDEVTRGFFRAVRRRIPPTPGNRWIVDLGCGTGGLTALLARAGRRVVGVDGSAPMLDVARARCRRFGARVRLVRADMLRLPAFPGCAAVVASADVFNHFGSQRAIARVFRQVRRTLDDGGVFAFDTLNRWCFERYWADRDYLMESDRGDLVMECRWDPRRRCGTARMVAYAERRPGSGSYSRHEAVLEEYLHEERDIRRLLRDAGFTRVEPEPWSPWDDQHLEPSVDRTLWFARP
jgi:SAM-dependent methyltransferase